MTITSALQNALSGLRANSRLAEITANNLANALTPGYGRQSVILTSAVTGAEGNGVQVRGVERALDPELSAARRIADGDLGEQAARFEGLSRLERAFGTAEDRGGLIARITAFEDALRQLSETPESGPRQIAAAEAAGDLANKFNQISTETARVRQSADGEIAQRVQEVNAALKKIAQINRQIQIFTASGRETAALIDERERLVDQVSQNVPIRESRRADGVVEIRTAEGLPLADTSAQQFSFTQSPVITADLSIGAGTLSGLTLDGRDVTPGAGGPQRVQGGAFAGLFATRDQAAPEFEARLDSLAADLIGRTPDPDPGFTTADPGLFTDAGAAFQPGVDDPTGLAGRIQLNALVDPAAGGDPARLRDGINAPTARPVADATFPRALLDGLTALADASATPGVTGNFSFAGRAGQVAELTATDRVTLEAEVSALGTAREALAGEESGQLGVDTDAELQRLIQIEQAYAANAQVIQTAARMLDQLAEIA